MNSCKIASLKTEYLQNPLGIDVQSPGLSWVIESTSRGIRQTAYQIIVASTEQNLYHSIGDLWNSGKLVSSQSIHVNYAGKTLQSGQVCFWKVRIWDQEDEETEWSETGKWSMGLLQRTGWVGKWIGLKSKREENGRPAAYLRKQFDVDKPIRRAFVHATALGVYEVYINGERVGEDYFTPEWTDYNTRVQYQTYDVSPSLHKGINAVGALVGDGWYAGHVGWFGPDQYGIFPRFLMQLHIEYEDGSTGIITTDPSWKASTGPILHADFMMGEGCDARLEQSGWNQPDFDEGLWKRPDVFFDYQGWITAQRSPKIRVTEKRAPRSINETIPGTWMIDMGQNMVGWVQITLKGKRGTEVRLRYGEILNPDGTLYTENLRAAKQTDAYILKGAEEETYEPHFTFHGFRYVEITCEPGDVTLTNVTGKVIHNDMMPTGKLITSNPLVNQLQRNIVWTQRANFISVPTDCPQRDERLGWMGDAQIFARTACYNMDASGFLTKFMIDIVDAQRPTGAFTDTAPYVKGTPDGPTLIASAGWADAGIIIPWTLYQVYGDATVIEQHYDAMTRWIDYIKAINPALLREDTQYFGDWLSLQADTPMDVFATAYFAYSTKLVAEMAEVLGRKQDALSYRELFNDIKEQFNQAYVSNDGRIVGDTQTCYAIALFMELLPEDKRQLAAKHLVNDIEQRGGHISTGIHGTRCLLPVLCEFGYEDVAYRLLLQDTYPSWDYSIQQGATTIWERWDGWTEEKGFQNPGMNSFNHYALGSVGEWLYRFVGGIDTMADSPGFKGIQIHPRIGGGLTFVECEYESMYGLISSRWEIEGDRFELHVKIPANTFAMIYIPVKDGEHAFESGISVFQSVGIVWVDKQEGKWILRVESGEYKFHSTISSETHHTNFFTRTTQKYIV
ncbi:MAG: glycoside hydrolase family 78 protein [Bacilli bacterium]